MGDPSAACFAVIRGGLKYKVMAGSGSRHLSDGELLAFPLVSKGLLLSSMSGGGWTHSITLFLNPEKDVTQRRVMGEKFHLTRAVEENIILYPIDQTNSISSRYSIEQVPPSASNPL